MPAWRRAVLSAALAVSAVHAHADPYAFTFSGQSSPVMRFNGTFIGAILAGVPTAIRGVGETQDAVRTSVGGSVVTTLTLDELTFAGFPLADRVLTHTVTGAGDSLLCMAATCADMGDAMPASWWDAPTPLDVTLDGSRFGQTASLVDLQPGGRVVLGSRQFDIDGAGGTIEYGWSPLTSPPFGRAPLQVIVGPVPEPATWALFGSALLAAAATRRARRARSAGARKDRDD